MNRQLPQWRSLLYVPASEERFVAKAHERGADAIILDLKDGVAPDAKARARAGLATSAASARRNGADIVVRINRPLRMAAEDMAAAGAAGADGLICTKMIGADHVRCFPIIPTQYCRAALSLAAKAVMFHS
ncbi:MAG: hypothetical protein FJX33_03250 [Alphaproteobacteria bacterium]|nr:hypothetical protein [Alphaproteobacteria bacterium]